jgi:hypothetical protein
MIPQATPDLGDLTEGELLGFLVRRSYAWKGIGYLITPRTTRRFYGSLGRNELAIKICIPSRKVRLPEILTDCELKALSNSCVINDIDTTHTNGSRHRVSGRSHKRSEKAEQRRLVSECASSIVTSMILSAFLSFSETMLEWRIPWE